jgi:restriction system protein
MAAFLEGKAMATLYPIHIGNSKPDDLVERTDHWSGRYIAKLYHRGLNKSRIISGKDSLIVEIKVETQLADWAIMWSQKQEKETTRGVKEAQKESAIERTQQCQNAIREIEKILAHTLTVQDAVDWDSLKDRSSFPKSKPEKKILVEPKKPELGSKPDPSSLLYSPTFNIFDKIFPSRARRKTERAKAEFESDLKTWEEKKKEIERTDREYRQAVDKANEQYDVELNWWENEKRVFQKEQEERNLALDRRKEEYLSGGKEAIIDYCDLVLSRSEYPEYLSQEFEIDYNSDTRILVVDYQLPSPEALPRVKEVKYVQSKDEFREIELSEAERHRLYDSLLYQIAIRTIHELFESDAINALDSVVFNGWVKFVNKGTGKEETACIMTVQASKPEFMSINLSLVDPKECFRKLKGVGSAKLHGLSPVAPLLQISREDKRFVSSYAVAHKLDDSINIAAMDWEDFEHLVRELFEKEFTQSGGEVKVTQASRDGGVDAIAFDPDPIRGGKLVIQAKRYTNIVGVGAVRDLYGTVINEGATKGILITTADYGSDAYEFAKGKPLTLLNGGNLLHLLAKHGHKAKIDLKEAKEILSEKKREES